MNYFKNHYKKINLLKIKDNESDIGLRECQVGAFWATLAHFTTSDHPALVVMPTGSGKTAVMMLLAFGLKASRVLIIEPAVILRSQTAKKFKSLDDLIKTGVLSEGVKKPKVHEQEGRVTSIDMWEAVKKYDVIVATPHTISPEQNKSIVLPPDNFFDKDSVIFLDEAHHTPAKTWKALLERFKIPRHIFLTATPFRNDNRKLLAKLIYNYPLGRAIDKKVYQTIEYHSVPSRNQGNKDELLCKKAKELLDDEKSVSHRTKIIVRTDKVRKCKPLINLYRLNGIDVDEVNYKKNLQENQAVIDAIKNDKLDGVICVGMLGEGLDIPELKIAVLHDPPKSLPFTLQFIGRISRPIKGLIGNAHVLADPSDVKGKMRKLYNEDSSWGRLVPKLVEEAIGKVAAQDEFYQTIQTQKNSVVNLKEIQPFFSARLYHLEPENLHFERIPNLGDEILIMHRSNSENFLTLITQTYNKPPWTKSSNLYSPQYDLHIYYYHQLSKTLFESTTSDAIASEVRSQVVDGALKRLKSKELTKAMQAQEPVNYIMLGLANILGQAPSLPAYKTLMGKEIQGAVMPTEGMLFTPGHALARVSKGETRGIGNFQGRVWAIKRDSLMKYKNWCDTIGNLLVKKSKMATLPELGFLTEPKEVEKFPSQTISVVFNYEAFTSSLKLMKINLPSKMESSSNMVYPIFKIKRLNSARNELSLWFYPNSTVAKERISLTYDIANNQWKTNAVNTQFQVLEDNVNRPTTKYSFEEFLQRYPPCIYLGSGGVIINGEMYKPKQTFGDLPEDCFNKDIIDWSQCDITVELVDSAKGIAPSDGKKSIHDWLQEKLIKETEKAALVLKDHGGGEIADFVVVEPEKKLVSFYHCKKSSKPKPGARIKDLGALEQAYRSIAWIRKGDLLKEILERSRKRPKSRLVKGSLTSAKGKKLASNFSDSFNEWKYQVVLVQPGLSYEKIIKEKGNDKKKANVKILLLACYEWLSRFNVKLSVMGSRQSEKRDK